MDYLSIEQVSSERRLLRRNHLADKDFRQTPFFNSLLLAGNSAQQTISKYLNEENQGDDECCEYAHKRKNPKRMLCRFIHEVYSDSSRRVIFRWS